MYAVYTRVYSAKYTILIKSTAILDETRAGIEGGIFAFEVISEVFQCAILPSRFKERYAECFTFLHLVVYVTGNRCR